MDIDILGSYPIILDGETVGELTVTREGLFWNFDAKCEMRGEIVRLSVYGDGKAAYLGIMEPIGDMLCLTKKLSRRALEAFPSKISHAGQNGETDSFDLEISAALTPRVESGEYRGDFPLPHFLKASSEVSSPPCSEFPSSEVHVSPPSELSEFSWRPCPLPCSLFSGLEAKKLCSCISGAYLAQDEDVFYLAVPQDITESLPETDAVRFVGKIRFEEDPYLICKIINGKSVSEL